VVLARERSQHDKWAEETDVEKIKVETFFEASTAPENRFILSKLGDLAGKTILELGCGFGEGSIYFALKGAFCIATDFSPVMIEQAQRLARRYGVTVDWRVMDASNIDYSDSTFDIVYAANLLHHVEPLGTIREMHRVLKPGGHMCFWDPLRHNPVINLYRKMATEVRTDDEKPLDINIVKFIQDLFPEVIYDTFWICTLWIFIKFFLFEHVHPNKERYWKKILSEEERLRPLYYRLEKIDFYLKKFPFLKRYAWNLAVVAKKISTV